MKIAMVSEHASPLAAPGSVDAGGQNVHVAALSTALADRGHEVIVYTRRDDPSLPRRVPLTDGVDVVHVDAGPAARVPKDDLLPHMPALAEGLAADWAVERPDVVHSHFWMSGLAALDAVEALEQGSARGSTGPVLAGPVMAGVAPGSATPEPIVPPVLHTFHALGVVKRRHQGAADTSPAERAWLEPQVGRRVDTVIATCSDEAFELRALGVPSRRIALAPCGVDPQLFRPDGPVEERGARFRVLSVGRLVPRKGVDLVLRALALLAEQGLDDVELVVGGTDGSAADPDPEIARLSALADELGVSEKVRFRGQVAREDMPALLRSADVVACTPWYEPFGIVPLESMACGTPVIAASVGGLIDSVVDGVTGLHVPPRDPEAIAAALALLLPDEDRRAAFGRAGRRRVESRYTWARVAAQTERIYQDVLAQAGRLPAHLEGAAL